MSNNKEPTGFPDRYWGELFLYGGIVGAIAAPIKLLIHHAFVWAHLAKPFYSSLNSYLIHGHYNVKGLMESIFAEFGDMSVGAMFGIVLTFLLRYSRPCYHWWIGILSGFGIWYFSLVFGNLTKIIKPNETTGWSLFSHLLSMLVFGLLVVLASRIWIPYRKRIDCPKNRIVNID